MKNIKTTLLAKTKIAGPMILRILVLMFGKTSANRNVLSFLLPFRYISLIVLLIAISQQFSYSQCIDCVPGQVGNGNQNPWSEECYLNNSCNIAGNPCTANDINLLKSYIADVNGNPIVAFDCDNTPPLYFWGSFENSTGTSRYAIRTYSQIWVDGVCETEINSCSFNQIPSKDTLEALLYGPFSFTCDQELYLLNTWLGWTTSAAQCSAPTGPNYAYKCGDYPSSKCGKELGQINLIIPNISFECNDSSPNNIEVCFTETVYGGTPPYTIIWDFGDGNSGLGSNVCHTFNTTSQSEFTVKLSVQDNTGVISQVMDTIKLPTVICSPNIYKCDNDPPFTLTGASGAPEGGTGIYYYISGGTYYTADDPITSFDPSLAGTGPHTISYEYADNTGCTAICYFEIIVWEHTDVSCPDDFAVCISDIDLKLNQANPEGGVYSSTTGTINLIGGDYYLDLSSAGSYLIKYKYTDDNLCVDSCFFTVTVSDFEIFCPPSLDLGGCDTDVLLTATGLVYSESIVSISKTQFNNAEAAAVCEISEYSYKDSKSETCPITVTRTFTVKNTDNETKSCQQVISIDDNTAPVITALPAPSTINCPASPIFAQATATDACAFALTFTDVKTPGVCAGAHSVTRTWTATDACNNVSTASQTINVQDITAPTITCPAQIVVTTVPGEYTANVNLVYPTAMDNCSSNFTFIGTRSDALPLTDPYPVGVTIINWTALDACGNTSLSCEQTIASKSLSIGDYVWDDLDGDGIQESGEPGLSGVIVELYNCDSNGSPLSSVTTDATGLFLFENMIAGSYYVKFILPGTYKFTLANQGASDLENSDVTGNNGFGTTACFQLNVNEERPDIDAGVYKCVEIGDIVWLDYNKDNKYNTGESGVNGLRVELYRNNNGNWVLWDYDYTDISPNSTCSDGYYNFCVNPGTYYIKFITPIGFVPAQANVGGNDTIDSDITQAFGHGTTDQFILVSGTSGNLNIDAGYYGRDR